MTKTCLMRPAWGVGGGGTGVVVVGAGSAGAGAAGAGAGAAGGGADGFVITVRVVWRADPALAGVNEGGPPPALASAASAPALEAPGAPRLLRSAASAPSPLPAVSAAATITDVAMIDEAARKPKRRPVTLPAVVTTVRQRFLMTGPGSRSPGLRTGGRSACRGRTAHRRPDTCPPHRSARSPACARPRRARRPHAATPRLC